MIEAKGANECMQHLIDENLENWQENEIEEMKDNNIPDGWNPKHHHTK